ncbi:MAG: hypothetical protein ABIH23_23330 [bacterium]
MNQGFRFSIQIGLAAALAVTVTGIALSWRIHQTESKSFRTEALALAESITPRLVLSQDPIEASDKAANQVILLDAAKVSPRIREISLIDQYGKVDARSQPADSEKTGSVSQWRENLTLQEVLASEETFVFPGRWEGFYSVRSPDGVYWGKLRVLWEYDRVQDTVNSLLFMTLLMAVSIGVLGLLVGVLLYRTTLSARVAEMGDRLRHIINSGFRGRVNTAALPTELADLGEQVNRVLDGLGQHQKRVVILEDSLRQTESSYHDLQNRSAQETETSEREQEMALYAFQQLFENISDGAVLTDGKGSVLALNGVAERWMHVLGQDGNQLSDDVLLRLIKRVLDQPTLDRDTSLWEIPDPLRGGRASGRATAVVLRREDEGFVYVLLLLRTEEMQGRRDWIAPLSERFLFEDLLPWLSKVLGERGRLPNAPVIWESIDRHVDILARLATLRQIRQVGPGDFHSLSLGPWLAQHLQATDLFSRMISVRFHSPRSESSAWTIEPMLGQAIDLLIEVLFELAEKRETPSLIDLFVDSSASGGTVLRFEIGFDLSSSSRAILRAIGNDRLDCLVSDRDGAQQGWSIVQHVRILGAALLRSLLGCRLDLREGEMSPLCVRWTFPPGGDHGLTGRAPSYSGSEVRVNRLIRNYLTRSCGAAGPRTSATRHSAADSSIHTV